MIHPTDDSREPWIKPRDDEPTKGRSGDGWGGPYLSCGRLTVFRAQPSGPGGLPPGPADYQATWKPALAPTFWESTP